MSSEPQAAASGSPSGSASGSPEAATESASRFSSRQIDLAVLLGLLAFAFMLRVPSLATRGTWDADQGHDMLVLRALVRDGIVPLLGPPTSIGDVHHGALYYYLLAPAAFLTGGDSPYAVTLEIALAGVAAVGVTWWLARSVAGSLAGFVAGLLMAVSASAIEESTFIWNPNLIALSSAIALAGAWRAWTTRRARWWLLAAAGTAMTMQCHVLGITLLPIVGALLIADARRRGPGRERRLVLGAGVAGLGLIALTYVPLVVHELTSDFSETNAALAWISSGGEPSDLALPVRLLIVLTRVITWPLTGLLTDAPMAALLALALVVSVIVWRWRSQDASERVAVRWLGLGSFWTAGFLTFAASGLARVVPGLPNDHYHAFADPMVFVLLGIGAAAAASTAGSVMSARKVALGGRVGAADAEAPPPPAISTALAVVVGVALVALVGWNLLNSPPAVAFDGGFPAADAAAARILAATPDRSISIRSIPTFKPADTYTYPVVRRGVAVVPEARGRDAGRRVRFAVRDRDRGRVRWAGGGCITRGDATEPRRGHARSLRGRARPLGDGLHVPLTRVEGRSRLGPRRAPATRPVPSQARSRQILPE